MRLLISQKTIRAKTCLGLLPLFASQFFVGCASMPQHAKYTGPPARPDSVEAYYEVPGAYTEADEEVIRDEGDYKLVRLSLSSEHGEATVDYFKRRASSDAMVFVFPTLGGRNAIANYFAEEFARAGFDTAVIHRGKAFKKHYNFDRLEELFRQNVIRDRMVISFFEEHYGKKRFGSFGLSRGGINVATTAGVDDRLQYNIIAMGGSDLVNLFRDSKEKGVKKYLRKVREAKGLTNEEVLELLSERIRTEPKYLAQYIDANNTLMFLCLFDACVPIKYGLKLRDQIGDPETVFLACGHFSAALFTQMVKLLLPLDHLCLFPMDYVETKSIGFFNASFDTGRLGLKNATYQLVHLPLRVTKGLFDRILPSARHEEKASGPYELVVDEEEQELEEKAPAEEVMQQTAASKGEGVM